MDKHAGGERDAVTRLKSVRAVFAIAGAAFACGAFVVAVNQADEAGLPTAIGISAAGLLFAVLLTAGVWFATGRILDAIQEMNEQHSEPRFEEEAVVPPDKVDAPVPTPTSTPQLDLDVDATATVVVDDVEETLSLAAAHLFVRDDFRGNVDLVVTASPGHRPDHLTQALLQHLRLSFEERETKLSPLAHEENDPDGPFQVVLVYSVTDLIGEFDRPRLEQWIDELASEPGVVSVFWDERFLGTVRVIVAD